MFSFVVLKKLLSLQYQSSRDNQNCGFPTIRALAAFEPSPFRRLLDFRCRIGSRACPTVMHDISVH